jgi:hypothetical protein
MAVVSPVEGTPDLRQGWSGARYTPEEEAEYRRRQLAGRPRHPAELARERAEAEKKREAERKASNPDPRAELRQAHARLALARDECGRLSLLVDRAEALVTDLEQRHVELVDAVRTGNRAAADRLVSALGQGSEQLPLSPRTNAIEAQLTEASGRLGVARDAVQQLVEEQAQARKLLAAAITVVDRAALVVAVDFAEAEAEAIEALAAELHCRRLDLWSLSAAMTNEQRRLGPSAAYTPPLVGRAIGTALDGRLDPIWNEKLRALRFDPDAVIEGDDDRRHHRSAEKPRSAAASG